MNRSERMKSLRADPDFRAKHKDSLKHRRPRGEVKAEREERAKRTELKRAEREERKRLRAEKKIKKENAREYVNSIPQAPKQALPQAPYCDYCGESWWCEHNLLKKTFEQNNF